MRHLLLWALPPLTVLFCMNSNGADSTKSCVDALNVDLPDLEIKRIERRIRVPRKSTDFAITRRTIDQLRDEGHDPHAFDIDRLRGKRVLDAGTGTSPLVSDLRKHGIEAFGVDINVVPEHGCQWCRIADIRNMPFFNNASFDVIFSTQSLFTYSPDNPQAVRQGLAELNRILRPGGEIHLAPVEARQIEQISSEFGLVMVQIIDLNESGYCGVSGCHEGVSVLLRKPDNSGVPMPSLRILTPKGGTSLYELQKRYPALADILRHPGDYMHAMRDERDKLRPLIEFMLSLNNRFVKQQVSHSLPTTHFLRERDLVIFASIIKNLDFYAFNEVFTSYSDIPAIKAIHQLPVDGATIESVVGYVSDPEKVKLKATIENEFLPIAYKRLKDHIEQFGHF